MAGSGRRPEHRGPPELVSGGEGAGAGAGSGSLSGVLGLTTSRSLSLQFYDEAEARKYTQKYGEAIAAGLPGHAGGEGRAPVVRRWRGGGSSRRGADSGGTR